MNGTILVVDDEPKIVKQARDYLERGGYRVLSAGDGATALSIARHERPDLVVLDLNLPSGRSPGSGAQGGASGAQWTAWTSAAPCAATRTCRSSCSPRASRRPTA